MTSTTPSVTFFISARISSLFLVLGMPPTNRRQLSTLAQTPRSLPFLKQQSCFVRSQKNQSVRSQESREHKVKAKPIFCPNAQGQTQDFGVSRSLGYSSGIAQCKTCHSAKSDIKGRQHSWNEGFEGGTKTKCCFSYARFSLFLPAPNPGPCIVTSGLWLPTHLWARFWGKKIPCHGEAAFEDSLIPTFVQTQKTPSFVHLLGVKVSLTGLEKCKTSLEESLEPGKKRRRWMKPGP